MTKKTPRLACNRCKISRRNERKDSGQYQDRCQKRQQHHENSVGAKKWKKSAVITEIIETETELRIDNVMNTPRPERNCYVVTL